MDNREGQPTQGIHDLAGPCGPPSELGGSWESGFPLYVPKGAGCFHAPPHQLEL